LNRNTCKLAYNTLRRTQFVYINKCPTTKGVGNISKVVPNGKFLGNISKVVPNGKF